MSEEKATSLRSSVKRIFKNTGSLVSGKAAAGLLSLGYLAIAARTLGPELVGVLVLVHTYAQIVAGIARFQSWQAVIRFGAPLAAAGDSDGLLSLLRYTIRLDLISGVAAMIIAAFFAPVVGNLLGWSPDVQRLIYPYAIAVPFLIAATPTGVLRLFDKFKILSWQLLILPGARFAGAIILWMAGAGVEAFIILFIISAILHGGSLWVMGLFELHQRNLAPSIIGKSPGRADKSWLPFMIKTNVTSSIELLDAHAPLMIVGAILGPSAAAFLKVAINLTNVLAKPITILNQAIFPELSKVMSQSGLRDMLGVCLRTLGGALAVAAPFVLLFVVFRQQFALLVGGSAFAPAAPLIALMAVAQPLQITTLTLRSAVLARGDAGWELAGQIIAASVNILLLTALLSVIGVIAAPIGMIAGWSALIMVMLIAAVRL